VRDTKSLSKIDIAIGLLALIAGTITYSFDYGDMLYAPAGTHHNPFCRWHHRNCLRPHWARALEEGQYRHNRGFTTQRYTRRCFHFRRTAKRSNPYDASEGWTWNRHADYRWRHDARGHRRDRRINNQEEVGYVLLNASSPVVVCLTSSCQRVSRLSEYQ
jgi:hypothetical protein